MILCVIEAYNLEEPIPDLECQDWSFFNTSSANCWTDGKSTSNVGAMPLLQHNLSTRQLEVTALAKIDPAWWTGLSFPTPKSSKCSTCSHSNLLPNILSLNLDRSWLNYSRPAPLSAIIHTGWLLCCAVEDIVSQPSRCTSSTFCYLNIQF